MKEDAIARLQAGRDKRKAGAKSGGEKARPTNGAASTKRGKATAFALEQELLTNPDLTGAFAMNEFARRPFLLRPIPRPGRSIDPNSKSRPLRDSDITNLIVYLESLGFEKVNKFTVQDAINQAADDNRFSPPRDMLEGLQWDGVTRLDEFFITYAGVAEPPNDLQWEIMTKDEQTDFIGLTRYVKAVTRCFFIGAVARLFRPGCKNDVCLILEGPQGVLKSTLLRSLAIEADWYDDCAPHDLTSKDARQHLPGKWIIEWAEIAQFKRSEIETVKAYMSCQTDRYRPSFARFEIDWPRQNTFCATTNSEVYFVDRSGNRRFWPLRATSIDIAGAVKVIPQVWAEAVDAFRKGEKWWLAADVEVLASDEQSKRLHTDPWQETIAAQIALNPDDAVTSARALGWVSIPIEKRTKADEMRIGELLRELGLRRRRVKLNRLDKARSWAFVPEGWEPK